VLTVSAHVRCPAVGGDWTWTGSRGRAARDFLGHSLHALSINHTARFPACAGKTITGDFGRPNAIARDAARP
jgi:hypothetical protein